jgi:hypothetical protein
MNDTGYIYKNKDGREVELKRAYKPIKEFGMELIQIKKELDLQQERKIEIPRQRQISF